MRFSEAILTCVEELECGPSSVRIRGWIVHPTTPIERVSVYLGNHAIAKDLPLIDRPDIRQQFEPYPFRKNALRSGFEFRAEVESPPPNARDVLLKILPSSASGSLGTVYSLYCDLDHEHASRPLPPAHLMQRIGGAADYSKIGVAGVGLILTSLGVLKTPGQIECILDWGCGSGRVTRQMAKCIEPARVHGCDIDPEAIQWAQANLPGIRFDVVPPHPPTAYASGLFDAIYGISVMTHLDEPTQLEWLGELRRITRPGAAVLLSVLGETMRQARLPAHLHEEFDRTGFAAYVPDYEKEHGFRAFSKEGYYKEAFHSIDYIERVWSRYFSIEEYTRTSSQDLVLLRRHAG